MIHYIVMYFITIITLTQSVRNTKVFTDNWNKNGNVNKQFFDPDTFGMKLLDPCLPIHKNDKFRDYINSNVKCTGQHCLNGEFKCSNRGKTDCYHVEHIIDENGNDSDITCGNGCKNIAGNMVMAWGKWNFGLGGLAGRYYQDAQNEKKLVYGASIVDKTKKIINMCALINKPQYEYDSYCDSDNDCNCDADSDCGCDCDFNTNNTSNNSLVLYIIIGILSILSLIGLVYMVLDRRNKLSNKMVKYSKVICCGLILALEIILLIRYGENTLKHNIPTFISNIFLTGLLISMALDIIINYGIDNKTYLEQISTIMFYISFISSFISMCFECITNVCYNTTPLYVIVLIYLHLSLITCFGCMVYNCCKKQNNGTVPNSVLEQIQPIDVIINSEIINNEPKFEYRI